MKYKYEKSQKFKIKGYDYKGLNYKMHLDAELRYYYAVFGHFMTLLVVAVMMLYYVLVYRHCVGYDLVRISI
jgi:hypothetical protein